MTKNEVDMTYMQGSLKKSDILDITDKLYSRAKNEDFSGFDPYDGLNTPLLKYIPILKNKWPMIFITQFFKRFPINLRPVFGIRKERNAKGIALFASGLINLYSTDKDAFIIEDIEKLAKWLKENRSPYSENYAWGYNFPWRSRNGYKSKYFPNVVTTYFVADTFLQLYKLTGKSEWLDIAVSAGKFMLLELNKYRDERGICFSYGPGDNERVYNATLFASRLLLDLWNITGNDDLLENGTLSANFVINSQNEDGSWFYGDNKNQKWIDNFHTGYNLWGLNAIRGIVKIPNIDASVNRGMDFYINNLFDRDLIPYYYHNRKYPIDIHASAVATIVFTDFGNTAYARKSLSNALLMFYSQKGDFYFRKYRFTTNKISYMRWSNAWMFYAMTEFLSKSKEQNKTIKA